MAELEIKPSPKMLVRIGVLIGSAATLVGVLVWLLTGGGVGLFARKIDVKTYMPDATGLGVGAPVRLNGIQVGAVRRIATSHYLDMQRAVRVDLRVESKYAPRIPTDSQTSIGSDTLIGDKFVDIAAGKERRAIGDGSELRSEPAETAAEKADLIFSIQDSLRKVDDLLIQVASPNTRLGHFVMGDSEYQSAIRTIQAFEASLRGLVARGTPTGNAVFSTSLYSKWDKSIRGIDDTLAAIQRGEGKAGQLYASDDQYNRILAKVRDLRKSIGDFQAQIAKTDASLQNDEAYQKLTRTLAEMDRKLAAINRGEGQFGQLLTSPQMYESLNGSLNNINAFLKDFRANPRKYLRMKLF
jgi:phospholipid/cholesterol/gamma-HCH transport system substrate-binding protein